jgi:hypothetical protein
MFVRLAGWMALLARFPAGRSAASRCQARAADRASGAGEPGLGYKRIQGGLLGLGHQRRASKVRRAPKACGSARATAPLAPHGGSSCTPRPRPCWRTTPSMSTARSPCAASKQVRARRCQGLLELRAGNRHNVTCGHLVSPSPGFDSLKDHEVAVSPHTDTPATGKPVTAGSATPYTTPVDVNRPPHGLVVAGIFVSAADGA